MKERVRIRVRVRVRYKGTRRWRGRSDEVEEVGPYKRFIKMLKTLTPCGPPPRYISRPQPQPQTRLGYARLG